MFSSLFTCRGMICFVLILLLQVALTPAFLHPIPVQIISRKHDQFIKPTVLFTNKNVDAAISSSLHSSSAGSSAESLSASSAQTSINNVSIFPCGDDLDKKILQLFFPAVLNFFVVPFTGACDTYFVGRMGNAAALAGQGAANQVFNSAFWFFSFLPSVITPLIAKASGANDKEALQQRVAEAIFVSFIAGLLGTILLTINPAWILSLVLRSESQTRVFAEPYLYFRGLTVIPSLLSTVGFAVFRGTLDVITPLKISVTANIVNILLDPLFIFTGGMGVVGAAVATCISDITAFALYARTLLKNGMLKLSLLRKPPSLKALTPLLLGSVSMQFRSIALNIALLTVTRTAQRLDSNGAVAAAHAVSMQLFQLGSVASLAMGTTAAIVVPMEIGRSKRTNDPKGLLPARQAANRLMIFGIMLGSLLGSLQLLSLPLISFFSPLPDVQAMARGPATIGALLQLLNCIVWTGEGIQQGNQDFMSLAIATALGAAGMVTYLKYMTTDIGPGALTSVWCGFVVLSLIRLVGVIRHLFFASPLTMDKVKASMQVSNDAYDKKDENLAMQKLLEECL